MKILFQIILNRTFLKNSRSWKTYSSKNIHEYNFTYIYCDLYKKFTIIDINEGNIKLKRKFINQIYKINIPKIIKIEIYLMALFFIFFEFKSF